MEVWMREAWRQSVHARFGMACLIPRLECTELGRLFERRVVIVFVHTEEEERRLMALGPCPMTMIVYVM
jgi:hypothetical protein